MVVCCIQEGNTPLHAACERGREGNKEVALLLIEHGADLGAKNKVRQVLLVLMFTIVI